MLSKKLLLDIFGEKIKPYGFELAGYKHRRYTFSRKVDGTEQTFVDDRARPEPSHRIILEEREQLVISGVEEVESFDESTIYLTTAQGALEIQGDELHIEKLSLDGGDLKVEGRVNALIYGEENRSRGGLLSRLLGG